MDAITTPKTYLPDTPSPRASPRSASISITSAPYTNRTDHDRKDKTKLKKRATSRSRSRSRSPLFAPRNSYVYDDEAEDDDEIEYMRASSLTEIEHNRAYDMRERSVEADITESEVEENHEETAASSTDGEEDRAKEDDRYGKYGIQEDMVAEEEWGDEMIEQPKMKLDHASDRAKSRSKHKHHGEHSVSGKLKPCSCGVEEQTPLRPSIPCTKCNRAFHLQCINLAEHFWKAILLGDDFFYFTCLTCGRGKEVLRRLNMSWIDVVHISLFNLTHTVQPLASYPDGLRYYHWKQDLCAFIDTHWEQFWLKPRGGTWHNSVASCLSTNSPSGRFESGKMKYEKVGWWALTDPNLFPSSYESVATKRSRSVAYTIDKDGLLHEMLSRSPAPPTKKRKLSTGGMLDPVASSSAAAHNRSHAKVKRTRSEQLALGRSASPAGSVKGGAGGVGKDDDNLYPDIDNPPGPVRMSNAPTHSASQFRVSDDGLTVWNEKGYRLAKASHGFETGTWYYEITITEMQGTANARVGFSQISGDLQGPCGFDHFSYGYRASPGTAFHRSLGRKIGDGFGQGDILGLLIHLPPCIPDERAELNARRWDQTVPYKSYARYHAVASSDAGPYRLEEIGEQIFPVVKGSEIVVFRNGVEVGMVFERLHLGKYYPAISSYMGCKMTMNFGAEPFKFAPPKTWHGDVVRPIADLKRSDDVHSVRLHVNGYIDISNADNIAIRGGSCEVSVDRVPENEVMVNGMDSRLSRDGKEPLIPGLINMASEKEWAQKVPLSGTDDRMNIDVCRSANRHYEQDSDTEGQIE
ncbi:hypothetical protein BC937DRAFT_87328 [Endogone sp. FLAS-F59071]|nr:hypothetical protein BC937DRAFT_87328 [Endogone sp. FLAS-F59071]|eukprot:RUS19537.1 hypothetical protein BC937DRAFT_87328 [Endogone sp. FLAS-F59071]